MSNATVVRYRTKPDAADENERLLRAVFEELAATCPDGLHYRVVRLDDGATFIHVAVHAEGGNPLGDLGSFQAFVSGIDERCEEGPTPVRATLIGSFPPLSEA
jgi:hypothetical protein